MEKLTIFEIITQSYSRFSRRKWGGDLSFFCEKF